MFALSAIGYRGAILSLGLPNYLMSATFTLAVGLVVTTVDAVGSIWWCARQPCMPAIMHGLAAFAVRRLHGRVRLAILVSRLRASPPPRACARWRLIEVLFAQLVARFAFGQRTTPREAIGMVLVVAGVVLLDFGVLVLVVRQNRQRVKLDALLVQFLGFLGRGFAVDRAVLGLAVMDLARLFRETLNRRNWRSW